MRHKVTGSLANRSWLPVAPPRELVIVVLLALLALACNRTIINPNQPSNGLGINNGTPTPTPTPVKNNVVQFRATGSVLTARVRYQTPSDGTNQVITTMPFDFTYNSTASEMFLSLDATPILIDGSVQVPFFSIQIVVNGQVFREAESAAFLLQTLSINGTWRQ